MAHSLPLRALQSRNENEQKKHYSLSLDLLPSSKRKTADLHLLILNPENTSVTRGLSTLLIQTNSVSSRESPWILREYLAVC